MTTTATMSGAGAGGMKGTAARGGGAGGWGRVWQVPVLVVGIAAFGFGVRAVVKSRKTVPFATHIADVQNLLKAGQYDRAVGQINTLGDYFTGPGQQAALQKLAGDAHYLAQKKEAVFVRENYQRVADHYRKATTLGFVADAEMNERWGEAALAIGDATLALEKLGAAIAADGAKLRLHARDLVAAHWRTAMWRRRRGY